MTEEKNTAIPAYCSNCGQSVARMTEATRAFGITWTKYDGACCKPKEVA